MPKLLRKKVPRSERPESARHLPLVKGVPDQNPAYPGCVLVRIDRTPKHPVFPKVNLKYAFQETYYRYDKKEGKVRCLVTVMPDGSRQAWDICRNCHSYFTNCRCKDGIVTVRSVEYCYDAIGARLRGEEWKHTHPNYKGSLTRADREARQNAPQRFVMPDRPTRVPPQRSVPAGGGTAPRKGRILRKVQPEPARKFLRKSTAAKVQAAVAASDLSAMNGAAEEMVTALAKELQGKKKLLKTGTSPKKLLRRSE